MDLRATEQQARTQFAKGQVRESAATFRCLSEQLPERLDLQAQLGYLALLANDLGAAVHYLAQVINRGLRSRQALAHLAEAYYRQGRLGAAAYCYQRLGRDGLAGTLAVMGELDAYRLTQSQASVEVPWVMTDPLPVLAVSVNGRDANLVLDTGAGDTLLATQFATDAGVKLGGQEQRTFAGGRPAWVTYGHLEELSLGDFGIQDIPVQIIDIPPGLAAWFPGLPIHGILGTGVFARFRTTLDYRCGCLRLEPPTETGVTPWQNGQRVGPGTSLWLAENQLLLTCVDLPALDKSVWFLDSGMTGGSFAVPESRLGALGLKLDEGAALVGAGGGGTVRGRKVRADWLRLDRLCRYQPDGVVLEDFPVEQSCGFAVQGLIGHDLLRDSILTLDFPAMQLFMSEENR